MQEQYRKNLEKLAAHLEKKPSLWRRLLRVKFSMRNYARNEKLNAYRELTPEELNEAKRCPRHFCGTVVCALGEAALLFPEQVKDCNFGGIGRVLFGIAGFSAAWYWMFDADWESVDNTREGAAARIRWFLKYGVPHDARQQMAGLAPLCYKVAK